MRMCSECGVEIPAKRLAAKPNATLCVTCQSQVDVICHDSVTDMSRLGLARTHTDDPKIPKFVTYGLASLFSSEDYKTGTAHNTFLYTVSNEGREAWASSTGRAA